MSREKVNIADLFPKKRTAVVEDVTMDEPRATAPKLPCVRRDLKCAECGATMLLRMSKKFGRPFYGCVNFPTCKGTHGAHPDGRPLGTPADKTTKQARIRAHSVFDLIWKQNRLSRAQAYAWMRKKMKLSDEDGHIGGLTKEQCEKLVLLVQKAFPSVRTVWDRLRENPYVDPRDVDADVDDEGDFT